MNPFRRIRYLASRLMLAGMVLLGTGCKAPWASDWKMSDMFRMDKSMPWHDDGPEKGVPSRLVGTWTDTILQQAGKTPQRGFGGRLVFYGKNAEAPILVEGQLVVYAFDESNRDPTDNRPTRRYVFPPDQLALRMSESELGPSYSFWLPWDEAGGPQTEVSLIARFEPKGGPVVVGEQTKHKLPGPIVPKSMLAKNTPPRLPDGIPMRPATQPPSYSNSASGDGSDPANRVALAVYESQMSGAIADPVSGMPGSVVMPQSNERRMTTTSISLPENFRLRGGTTPTRTENPPVGAVPYNSQFQQSIPAAPAGAAPATGSYPAGYSPLSSTPGAMPGAMPYMPSAAVTPLSQASAVLSLGSSESLTPLSRPVVATQTTAGPMAAGQTMPTQSQMPVATEVTTSVSYLSPADSARLGLRPQPSGGYQPATPPAPTTPVSR